MVDSAVRYWHYTIGLGKDENGVALNNLYSIIMGKYYPHYSEEICDTEVINQFKYPQLDSHHGGTINIVMLDGHAEGRRRNGFNKAKEWHPLAK